MNLRKIGEYSIGLDLGSASVGWAVVDADGELAHFKGRPTWGSRLFPSAQQASEARAPRGQRRRYIRRRNRINYLQQFFADAMRDIDEDFFIRLNQSQLLPEDRDPSHASYKWPLFNDQDFSEKDYYDAFPTIFHLRKHLIESHDKADLRLVYLAMHHIVKYRGNFLRQEEQHLSAKNADMGESVSQLLDALQLWSDEKGLTFDFDKQNIVDLLSSASSRAEINEQLRKEIKFANSEEYGVLKISPELSKAILGYKADFSKIILQEVDDAKFSLSDGEKVDAFLSNCPDESVHLFDVIRGVYSAYILKGILVVPGLSASKVVAYEKYAQDLKLLKALFREYNPKAYNDFFRGPTYCKNGDYDVSKAQGYTLYNIGTKNSGSGGKAMSYDDFKKSVEKQLKGTGAEEDERFLKMMSEFDEQQFLRKLRTSDNGQIPFQLHLEELEEIIDSQGEYYPFLRENKEKILSLVSFRIPYYVGPLVADAEGNTSRFAWSVRKEGMENKNVRPWNWEEVIDKHASAEAFIQRMTGTCTYLDGEPVLPKCSLLYEEFCVLNELNGAKWTQDGDKFYSFSYDDRQAIMQDLFSKYKVSQKRIEDWLSQNHRPRAHVVGFQGETGFESKLSSYIFFCKDVFHVDELPEDYYPMCEQIILWNTLFEDRSILKEKIRLEYGQENGGILNDAQVDVICKKRFTGWGRLSKKLLTGVKVNTDNGEMGIMDIMRDGDPNNRVVGKAMVFMSILRDDMFGFEETIQKINDENKDDAVTQVNDLPGSPAIRRTINQAIRIVDEIVSITKHAPQNIFIEVTRDEDSRKKGQRSTTRYNQLKTALSAFQGDISKSIRDELEERKASLDDDRLMLYFAQNGKCLYSGKPLDIRHLSSYQIDHIIPQSYIKDDSLDNRALVLPGMNQDKADNMLISADIRRNMASTWKPLRDAKLISDKKYNNLMRNKITENQMKGFIARQIVETSQSVKLTQQLLQERYPETNIRPVKASLSSQLRGRCKFVKSRLVNDYHHAHDAYIACQIGRFIQLRHPVVYDNPIALAHAVRAYVKRESENAKRGHSPADSTYLISSFLRSGFDKETGEVREDAWDAEFEVARMRKCLSYRDCHISRMPEETSGAFWDATLYSPSAKDLDVSIKENLDPKKYGGFSNRNNAYFFLFAATDKKGKEKFFFGGVPVNIAGRVKQNASLLEERALSIAGEKFVSIRIVQPKIFKYQVIEFEGERFFLPALDRVYSATQIALSNKSMITASKIEHDIHCEDDELICLYDELIDKPYALCSRFNAVKNTMIDGRRLFLSASYDEKTQLIINLLRFYRSFGRVDLSLINGSRTAGFIGNGFVTSSSKEIVIVHQSVTGLYEKRRPFGF